MSINLKKSFFFIITLLIPLFFFIFLELILRIADVGNEEKLVIKIEEQGKEYYQLNPAVARRYFIRTAQSMVPQLYPQKFPVKKSAETVRIFLLGGSTMAGFPYQLNARINSLLQDRLSTYFPQKNFEVINFGLSAINSFTVLDFAREIVKYQPDLVIIYMGHNEFYGAFGVGSVEHFARNPRWVRFYLQLRHLRTFQLLRNLIAKIFIQKSDETNFLNPTLMEKIAEKKTIPLESEDFKLAVRYFRENLKEIVDIIKDKKIKIFLSTLTSNLKDQSPFVSLFSDSISNKQKMRWEELFKKADEEFKNKNFQNCFEYLQQCGAIDSRPAKLHFLLGKYFLAQKDSLRARKEFIKAKDRDALRFRAPTVFNKIIEEIAAGHKIPIVHVDSTFNAASPNKIVGYELITEHLHPNIRGYELMAKSFAAAFLKNFPMDVPPENLSFSDDYFHQKAAITILDQAIGDFAIQHLTSRWPFRRKRTLIHYDNPEEKNFIESLVRAYASGNISWNRAHYKLAEFYIKKNQIENAIKEYLAVIKVAPEDYFAYFKLGNLFFTRNQFDEAVAWYKKALQRNDKPFIKAKIGMVYLNMSRFADAARFFRNAIEQDETVNNLSGKEKSFLYYYFAISQIKLGKSQAAKKNLQKALQFNPKNAEANQLLQLLMTNKNVRIKL